MVRVCRNNTLEFLRTQFGANPMQVPEQRVLPLCVLEIEKHKPKYLGEFRHLVKEGFDHPMPVHESQLAEVSATRTSAADYTTGFSILGGFLKALGLDPAAVSAGISHARKVAFSFENVRRKYVDVLQLGNILSEQNLHGDKDNFILQPALTSDKISLALITDIIVSNNFTVISLSESETQVDLSIPDIAHVITGGKAGIKVEKSASNAMTFTGPDDLTFAFSCLEIRIDRKTGKFSRGEWLTNVRDANGKARTLDSIESGEEHLLDHILIDENREYPLLIDL